MVEAVVPSAGNQPNSQTAAYLAASMFFILSVLRPPSHDTLLGPTPDGVEAVEAVHVV